jgi:hypothetical protein
MNYPLKENIDSLNNNYNYLRDKNGAVNRESVIVIDLPTNKFCQLLTSNWSFVREQTLGPSSLQCQADIRSKQILLFCFQGGLGFKIPV